MKPQLLLAFLLLSVCAAVAQDSIETVRSPHWNYGIWADYGNGLGTRSDVHIGGAGFRVGRVLTNEHGSNWMRGTFEYDIDLTPVEIYHFPKYTEYSGPYTILWPSRNYYTGGLNPFVAKWNFTKGQKWVPYIAAEGGVVFSDGNMPQGDTAETNFTSGAAFGAHRFVSDHGAWTFQGKVFHLSNASIGNHNPGVNIAMQFKIGYTWFKK
ncbi:hypothetical protein Acid345_2129 [Candidatus Koribacter versatilis Ellin345]|uniref:Lipid A 3-O-deacylase-related protein n=1 Tax=Koribacter versatilis (strain Ellin345) TaxID=204669 RepID=Q1IPS0_KORVE|nr:acyloxyacyl hydrolase [Candidatus Koribacter versatilis]ABF41130.1 hypothetical protein Acid345_2129 [Candidatus Koribacter versatilis Ellin345]